MNSALSSLLAGSLPCVDLASGSMPSSWNCGNETDLVCLGVFNGDGDAVDVGLVLRT